MEECRKHKLNQKAGSFAEPNPECSDFYLECPDTSPGLSGTISGVSGYSCRVHNAPTLKMQNFFKTMNDMKTMNVMMHDRPTLPSYAETPNKKIT